MLQVISGYRGERTQEQYIPPGYYEEDDPRLHSCGEFLIETGRAQKVSAVATFPPETLVVTEGLEGGPLPELGSQANEEYIALLEDELVAANAKVVALEAEVTALKAQLDGAVSKADEETPPTGEDTEPLEAVEGVPPADEVPADEPPKKGSKSK